MTNPALISAATTTAASIKDNIISSFSGVSLNFLLTVGLVIVVSSLIMGALSVFLEGKYGKRIF